jgi:hypothetical protein
MYEEDTGRRDEADLCERATPGTEGLPAGHWLMTRHQRRRFRGDRVLVEGRDGSRWASLRPSVQSVEDVQRLLARVQQDLNVMTLSQFGERYRRLKE